MVVHTPTMTSTTKQSGHSTGSEQSRLFSVNARFAETTGIVKRRLALLRVCATEPRLGGWSAAPAQHTFRLPLAPALPAPLGLPAPAGSPPSPAPIPRKSSNGALQRTGGGRLASTCASLHGGSPASNRSLALGVPLSLPFSGDVAARLGLSGGS